ncbi:PE family protein [Nocardia mangyaensis]|uniref:PE family protein n=1 Tax=Nocardia mangyaensis TaxID=2213200 RepID=UPI002674F877|nr:PE family protein [Nocardia mangyaensis]MDO3648226.1 PE family protein [Nocardia mangyaensis]
MVLNVDPEQLVGAAAELSDMVRVTGAALPAEWVTPAGADPISAGMVPALNDEAAQLINGMRGLLSVLQRTAHAVGAAAVDYTATDSTNAALIDGTSGDIVGNPVELPGNVPMVVSPSLEFPDPGLAADPLSFAQMLHAGPGPAAPARFAGVLRAFNSGAATDAGRRVGGAAEVLRSWTPVGAKASAELTQHNDWLDRIRRQMDRLADRVDAYSAAFRVAKDKHPTPSEIVAARKELLRAMRSKNEAATSAALAKHEELNLRSAETIGGYEGSMAADAAAAGSENSDSSMLQSLLPALLSAMSQGGMLAEQTLTEGAYDEYYGDDYYRDYGDYGGSGYGTPSPIGGTPGSSPGSSIGANPAYTIGPMPMSAAPAAASGGSGSGASRAAGFEPMRSGSASSGSAMGRGGYMPMMPMMPGAGGAGAGAGGGDRGRVVAWHPDRLMYVDDTPHTESVIGERPVIAPTVTPPTPAPASPTRNNAGGSA